MRSGCSSERGYGQLIRDDGPTTHHTKRGTPTMGGAGDHRARPCVGYFLAHADHRRGRRRASALLLLFLMVGLGIVGFLDDYIKISRQRSLGLRSRAKFIGQTVVAVAFGFLALSPWLEDDSGQTPAATRDLVHPRHPATSRLPRDRPGALHLADDRRRQQRA